MKTIKGMYWHCHHNILVEYVYDYNERVDYIKKNKPKNEIEIRLKLFQKVKGKLPVEFIEAWKKYYEAGKKCDEAGKKCDEAGKKYDEARKKYYEAWKKYYEAGKKCDEAGKKCDEARKKYKSEIEELHKKECGCKEWIC